MNAPIFIVGANRSGTTLLRLMLNAHSRIAVPEELLYLRSHYAGVRVEDWRNPTLSTSDYTAIVRDFVSNTVQLHPSLDADALTRTILAHPSPDLRRPYEVVLQAWADQNGKERWGEKTPGNLFYVDILREMFPSAYFLYVVRDPRAGVASMLKTDFFPEDVVFNALSRRKHARVGLQLLRNYVAPGHWMTVRYEDLTTHSEETLRQVCRLIGEPYEDRMLHFHRTAEAYMKEDAASSFNATATRPVTTRRVDAWRDQLSERTIALVETICADEMQRHDYSAVGRAMTLGAWAELALKATYWRVQCWRNRDVRHYTVKHALLARFRSRLLRGWEALVGWIPFRSARGQTVQDA